MNRGTRPTAGVSRRVPQCTTLANRELRSRHCATTTSIAPRWRRSSRPAPRPSTLEITPKGVDVSRDGALTIISSSKPREAVLFDDLRCGAAAASLAAAEGCRPCAACSSAPSPRPAWPWQAEGTRRGAVGRCPGLGLGARAGRLNLRLFSEVSCSVRGAMKERLWLLAAGVCSFVVLSSAYALAHSGGLNGEGCHTNRKTGDYHCHGGRQASSRTELSTTPSRFLGSANQAFGNCSAARAAGAAPVRRGNPGYGAHLDRDNDGIACE